MTVLLGFATSQHQVECDLWSVCTYLLELYSYVIYVFCT